MQLSAQPNSGCAHLHCWMGQQELPEPCWDLQWDWPLSRLQEWHLLCWSPKQHLQENMHAHVCHAAKTWAEL